MLCNFKNLEILNLKTTLTITLYLFQLNIDFLETKLLPLPMAGRNVFVSNSLEKKNSAVFFVTAKNICKARGRPSVGHVNQP